ncbi:hypothetical protein GC098_26950 [Paenibacillus sp. LMG 31458]|uniref:Short-chain dehydrogenase n=1 Tax=Paenibacillus phytorum TaxID=2654977 RepID=A0ABX1Y2K3_9BACL|nr:hypothetical protein [Paenibacillus phytorum]NOU74981.1 hypothetical protein [Paenibacillus phytorum]
MNYLLYIIGSGIVVIGLILSFIFARKQEKREMDNSMSAATYKHRVVANPGFIAYVSFILIGLLVIGYVSIFR